MIPAPLHPEADRRRQPTVALARVINNHQLASEPSSVPELPCGLFDRLYSCCIVRLAHLIGDILDVDDAISAINHHDRPLQEVPLPEPHAVVLTELHAVMG